MVQKLNRERHFFIDGSDPNDDGSMSWGLQSDGMFFEAKIEEYPPAGSIETRRFGDISFIMPLLEVEITNKAGDTFAYEGSGYTLEKDGAIIDGALFLRPVVTLPDDYEFERGGIIDRLT